MSNLIKHFYTVMFVKYILCVLKRIKKSDYFFQISIKSFIRQVWLHCCTSYLSQMSLLAPRLSTTGSGSIRGIGKYHF